MILTMTLLVVFVVYPNDDFSFAMHWNSISWPIVQISPAQKDRKGQFDILY